MSRPTTEQRLANKHEFFRSDFDKIQAAVRDVRIQCLSDRRFYSIPGAQYKTIAALTNAVPNRVLRLTQSLGRR